MLHYILGKQDCVGRNRRLRPDGPVVPPSGHAAQRATLWVMRLGFVAVALMGLSLLSASVWRSFVAIDALKLTTVEVRGAKRASKEALLAAAGADYGAPLMTLNLGRAASAMTRHPWVRTATLRRQLPNRLHIDVQEHSPKALVMLNTLWVVNTLGEPFKPFVSDDAFTLPVITGIVAAAGLPANAGATEEGSKTQALSEEVLQALATSDPLQDALALIDAVHGRYMNVLRVEQVQVDEDLGFSLYLQPCAQKDRAVNQERPVVVHLGQNPLGRVAIIGDTLERLHKLNRAAMVVWANGHRAPNRVQVRPYGPFEQFAAKGAEK